MNKWFRMYRTEAMNKWFRVYRTSARGELIAVPADTPRQLYWCGGRLYRLKDLPRNVKVIGEKP